MARYAGERRGESRRRILDTASKRFRAEGVDGVGIASLMADSGLTNGAFYAHFDSKDELVREAVAEALVGASEGLGLRADSDAADLRQFIEAYISAQHRDHAADGCAMAALAPELSRRPPSAREPLQASGMVMIHRIAKALPMPIDPSDRLPRAIALFSLLLGTLQMARFVSEGPFSDAILARGRMEALRIAGFRDGDGIKPA